MKPILPALLLLATGTFAAEPYDMSYTNTVALVKRSRFELRSFNNYTSKDCETLKMVINPIVVAPLSLAQSTNSVPGILK